LRASSLSNAKIIALLNGQFVPVFARNADYRDAKKGNAQDGAAPAAEKAEYFRIFQEAGKAKLSTGSVHVYLLNPDGHPIDSLHVANATKPDRLLEVLERTVKKLNVKPGEPLLKPAPKSVAPPAEKDALVLHLTARYLTRKGDDYVRMQPVLGTDRSSQWSALPSEDWITLSRADWTKLLPAKEAHAGDSWRWDKDVAKKLLDHFYPPTENTDVRKNRIDQQALKATVLSIKDGVVRARIDGNFKMKHPFYHKDTNEFIEANLIGFMDFDLDRSKIRSLRLVTDRATYGGEGSARQHFGVAVRSVP
jgi:hypothetical protein